ncbi:acetate/propionate family kinase [Pseudooceanicola algae]|uniref:Acetate kinase n=1 Tax=Pseudooceanicola algae TaxID=1537215 RepID=A0A418SEW5_9RHOB|nr:acetate/propionate family kinase [Pseudooceanicola algae]QPM90214.1 Acetate kinase [Pseudooceanicola algae]
MTGAILTLNAGSSSLKFGLFDLRARALAAGLVDHVGTRPVLRLTDTAGTLLADRQMRDDEGQDHGAALMVALGAIAGAFPDARIEAVGHRVVHGGTQFSDPVRLDAAALAYLDSLVPFAPLHQPHNLSGIRAAIEDFPDAAQIACFDTGFHRGHPFVNDTFALPRSYYDAGIRRYGFHGLSYRYIAGTLAEGWPELAAGRVIAAHLGNGASMTAMRDGASVASTMGFSTLDGLPMGTRSGQIDPGVLLYLLENGMTTGDLADLLYRDAGLKGMSGIGHDMRQLLAAPEPAAADAIAYFVARIRREIGGLAAELGGLDALVFTGGIGENAPEIRARVCQDMAWLGLTVDPQLNARNATEISGPDSRVRTLVIPTNEELVIARAAAMIAAKG